MSAWDVTLCRNLGQDLRAEVGVAGLQFGSGARSPWCRPAPGRRGRSRRRLTSRKQPEETALPIVSGWLVPWMR